VMIWGNIFGSWLTSDKTFNQEDTFSSPGCQPVCAASTEPFDALSLAHGKPFDANACPEQAKARRAGGEYT
jgi:hypothetical protein